MGDNILYVFDKVINSESEEYLRQYGDKDEGTIFVCPMTIDEVCISSTLQKLQLVSNLKIVSISFLKYFNEKAFLVRDEFIQFIAEFAERPLSEGKNLKEYLKCPWKRFSTWWFSLIAEKNPLKTDSYRKLIGLLTILDIQKKYSCQKIWLNVGDGELTHALMDNFRKARLICNDFQNHKKKSEIIYLGVALKKTLKRLLSFVLRSIYIKINMKRMDTQTRILTLRNSQYLLVTYFPLVDKERLKQEEFINKYYEPLQRALQKKYNGQFTWIAIIVKTEGFDFKRSVALGKEINRWGHSLFFCEEWLTLSDLFVIALQCLYVSFRFLLKEPYVSRVFNYPTSHTNIWQLFREDWYYSFCAYTLIEGLLYYRVFKNIFRQLKGNSIVTYLAEMHHWEKALNLAAKERKDLKVIAVQHTTVPLLELNYFSHKLELQDIGCIQGVPKPDYLACVGKIPARLFEESGWDKDKVFIWGAMRYQHLRKYVEKKIPWEKRKRRIVLALSIKVDISKELLLYTYQAFRDCTKYQVIVKEHLFCQVLQLVTSLNIELNENVFRIAEASLSELLPTAKAMIVAGTSASLDGICCQCPVIIPRLSTAVDINPLSGVCDLALYVNSPAELRKVVDEIMKKEESPISYERCKAFAKAYLEFLNSDEEFLNKLELRTHTRLMNR